MVSIITSERSLSCLPSSEDQSMTSPISEVYNIMGESSACLRMVTCVRITSTIEHHTVFRNRNGGIMDCVVVTMALVSGFSYSENVALLTTLLIDSVHGKSLLVEPYQRHLASCIIRSPLPHHHVRSLLLPLHSSQSSPSPPWLARCLSFRLGQSET